MNAADFSRGIKTAGDPARPPIVFLHGIRLGGKIWEQHARELSDEFYVVTPDLPGHGALAGLPFDAPTLDEFLGYIAEEIVSGAPLIVGYSLGGYVGMRFACALPDRTSGLLLTGSSANIVGYRRALYASVVGLTAHIPPSVIQSMLGAFFRIALPPRVANVVIPFRFNHRVFEQSLRLAGGVCYSEMLASYRKPVLLVNGKWDLLFRCHERAFAKAADARLVVMPRTDHVAPLRQPSEFSAIVRDFARDLFPSVIHTQGRTAQGPGC